ncbi:SAM-dependent methyltransferases [Candidatus Scalindua japonica]|uniref:SAM-dependent methyltransferases n=1 Tax=Candidatus Scalindua japonica TaxID=1284222 RepID=A0A286TWM9_9BACT|nr:class I SAM-dependent methyltransferase [Candidatus Scalindua japonica]GAX60284.1 SAM-dependent methyltransferases [Candidatus Scalindua japonica]
MYNSKSKEGQNLEYVSCCLCGGNTFDNVLISNYVSPSNHQTIDDGSSNSIMETFNLVRCRNCGLQQVNPRPSKQHIGRYYTEDYYAHTSLKVKKPKKKSLFAGKWIDFKDDVRRLIRVKFYNYPCSLEDKDRNISVSKRIFSWLFYLTYRSRLDIIPFTGEGKILDLGCGNGRFLSTMRKFGWQTYGVEKNPTASRYARDELHLDVKTGELLHYQFESSSFDTVTMWHSLEHLYDPLCTLKEIGRVLNNNGQLIVAVPNIDSFVAKVFKTYWYGLQLPIHLIAFTPGSITKMLNQAGFDVKKIYLDRRGATLRLSLLNLKDGKYRVLSRLSRFKGAIKALNFILAMFGSCDIIVIHARKKATCDV